MGAQLAALYKEAEAVGSLKAKMRLAMMTKVSSADAASAPDDPQTIAAFKAALAEIQKEFK